MKRNVILWCDIIVFFIVVEWSRLGPWDKLLGFDVYHSRGDVWLPTPPAAAAYFRAIVSTGSSLFAIFFVLTSCLLFFLGRSRGAATDEKSGLIYRAFYGDTRKLIVKYSVVLLVSFISPFFYTFRWQFRVTREYRIASGSAMTVAAFLIVLLLAELAARPSSRPQIPPNNQK